jgi:hypothetical protein
MNVFKPLPLLLTILLLITAAHARRKTKPPKSGESPSPADNPDVEDPSDKLPPQEEAIEENSPTNAFINRVHALAGVVSNVGSSSFYFIFKSSCP